MPAELQIALALISTSTVVGGFVFAAYQFVTFVRQRRQETALTLMKTTQPPEIQVGNSSSAAASKESEANWRTRSRGVRPQREIQAAA